MSDGCKFCYAEAKDSNPRFGAGGNWGPPATTPRRTFGVDHWKKPLTWNRAAAKAKERRRVFSSSMCDNFEDHPTVEYQLRRLWAVIRKTPHLDWQLLTKRPERITSLLPHDWDDGYPNVWLGVSVEDMRVAERVDELRRIPAVVRFISYEPALGPLDDLDLRYIDWVIYGGESGPKFREHDIAWPRAMRDRCADEDIAFYFKQSSARFTERGIELDGKIIRQYPVPRLVKRAALPEVGGLF